MTTTETAAGRLGREIADELARAQAKFPGKNVTFAALIEEIGELATALFSEPAARVRAEATQVSVMAMRVALEGDHTFAEWRQAQGLDPLADPIDPAEQCAECDCAAPPADCTWIAPGPAAPTTSPLTPPAGRVTPAMVDAEIADEDYHTPPGTRMTICTLTLANGFTVTGESGCTDPNACDPELGRDLAKGKARGKVFEFLAFRLRDELHRAAVQRARNVAALRGSKSAETDALIRAAVRDEDSA